MKGVLSVDGFEQRYVFQVLFYNIIILPFYCLFTILKLSNSNLLPYLLSGCAFHVGWQPRKNMGTQWKEDKQARVHWKEFRRNCPQKRLQRLSSLILSSHALVHGKSNWNPYIRWWSTVLLLRKIEKQKLNIKLTFDIQDIQFTESLKGNVFLTNNHVCAWTTVACENISFYT